MSDEQKPTHILLHYRSQNQTQMYEAESGQLLAVRIDKVVRFPFREEGDLTTGNGCTARLFINVDKANAFLRARAGDGAEIEERDGEPMIQTADMSALGALNTRKPS